MREICFGHCDLEPHQIGSIFTLPSGRYYRALPIDSVLNDFIVVNTDTAPVTDGIGSINNILLVLPLIMIYDSDESLYAECTYNEYYRKVVSKWGDYYTNGVMGRMTNNDAHVDDAMSIIFIKQYRYNYTHFISMLTASVQSWMKRHSYQAPMIILPYDLILACIDFLLELDNALPPSVGIIFALNEY